MSTRAGSSGSAATTNTAATDRSWFHAPPSPRELTTLSQLSQRRHTAVKSERDLSETTTMVVAASRSRRRSGRRGPHSGTVTLPNIR